MKHTYKYIILVPGFGLSVKFFGINREQKDE